MGTGKHRIVVVTAAGRRACLDLLKHYVLRDPAVDEWHLWDNCRDPKDRAWIEDLAHTHERVKVVRSATETDGKPASINHFYFDCTDRDTFYIRIDDDVVFLPDGFAGSFAARAEGEQSKFFWWSPIVVNNAICSWLLKHHSKLDIKTALTASAACNHGWRSPYFAEAIHRLFLEAMATGRADAFICPDVAVTTARFSINCIGFFGSDVVDLGTNFCPPGVDEEEWISAVLPSITGRPGRVIGDLTVAHYSFFPQQNYLNATDILDRYYALAGLRRTHPLAVGNPQIKARAISDWWERVVRNNRAARRYPLGFAKDGRSLAERVRDAAAHQSEGSR